MKKLLGLLLLSGLLFLCNCGVYAISEPWVEKNGIVYTVDGILQNNSGADLPFIVERSSTGLKFTDKDTGVTASVSITSLNDYSLQILRSYYNDYRSSDKEIFYKFVNLKKSYITAAQELYHISFLYGDSGNPASESNMKLFSNGTEYLFGQKASVYLYNINKTTVSTVEEKTHLDLIIPSKDNFAIISIFITIDTGSLDEDAKKAISEILSHLVFEGMPQQYAGISILNNKSIIDKANSGIYPSTEDENLELSTFVDTAAGFEIKYPSVFTPFIENEIGGRLTYKSFKIEPDTILSITSEPIGQTDGSSQPDLANKSESSGLSGTSGTGSSSGQGGTSQSAGTSGTAGTSESAGTSGTAGTSGASVIYDPLFTNTASVDSDAAIAEKIKFIKAMEPFQFEILQERKEAISGRDFFNFEYKIVSDSSAFSSASFASNYSSSSVSKTSSASIAIKENNTSTTVFYVNDYLITNNNRLYCIELRSRNKQPSESLKKHIRQILSSLKFSESALPSTDEELSPAAFNTYQNEDEGYGFSYPAAWELEDISGDINYDILKLNMPEFSANISIYTTEGELKSGYDQDDIIAGIAGIGSPDLQSILKKYNPPFFNNKTKLLSIKTMKVGDIFYIYRLVEYLDSSDRNKLCYAVDAIKGVKIYSMFISVSEYTVDGGKITTPGINSLVNRIAYSFKIMETDKSKARAIIGETRNRKVVALEKIMKKQLGQAAIITSATKTASDGSLYIIVDNIPKSGYYRVLPNFAKNTAEILDKTLKTQILASEIQKVYINTTGVKANSETAETTSKYKTAEIDSASSSDNTTGTEVESIFLDADDMSFSFINSSTDQEATVSKNYHIDVTLTENGLTWDTRLDRHAAFIRDKFEKYTKKVFADDARVYFSSENEFNDIENYRKSNCNYYTAVYIAFDKTEVSFILEVNPWNDNIRIVDFKSSREMADDIQKAFHDNDEFPVYSEYYFDAEDQIMTIYYDPTDSDSSGQIEEKYKARFNPETMELNYIRQ